MAAFVANPIQSSLQQHLTHWRFRRTARPKISHQRKTDCLHEKFPIDGCVSLRLAIRFLSLNFSRSIFLIS